MLDDDLPFQSRGEYLVHERHFIALGLPSIIWKNAKNVLLGIDISLNKIIHCFNIIGFFLISIKMR